MMNYFRKKGITAHSGQSELLKYLSALDLILLGVGAVVGAGLFVLSGIVSATQAGPAIVFSYLLAGLCCAFSALSYAELAASIGGCGSAYGYAYAGFGEIIAWVVGWDLLLEYTITVSAVSVGWSSYVNDLLLAIHVHLPAALLHGPREGGIVNSLSVMIIVLLAGLLTLGIKSSTRINNIMVAIKLFVVALFVMTAATEFKAENWVPFMPFGWHGVVQGASLIFFSYVGFDAVSTAAEEAVNPQRDLPIGIVGSLVICTLLYILVSGLLTGIAHYETLNVASPVSYSLLRLGHRVVSSIIGVGAIAGLTTVMLVLFYGLTRIFLAMSRDGLLPGYFAYIHTVFKSPIRIILLCGVLIATLGGLIPLAELAELVNIGTLFAFMVVCGGVIILRYKNPELVRPFKTPLMPYIPALGILSCAYLIWNLPGATLIRFSIWMCIGVVFYFSFSRKNSALAQKD